MNIKLSIVVVYSVLSVMLNAQTTSTIPAVAILDFESRGLPTYEVETLTERLRSEAADSSIASRQSEQVDFHRNNYLKIWSC